MPSHKKITDPQLTEAEQDALLEDFITREENAVVRKRWERLLQTEHGYPSVAAAHDGNGPQSRATVLRVIKWVTAVAAVALLAVAGWWMMEGPPDQSGLLAQHRQELSPVTYRGGNDPESLRTLRQRFLLFMAENADEDAQRIGRQLLDAPGVTKADSLNYGIACLQAANYGEAEALFSTLVSSGPEYRAEATYYLGLTQLSKGEKEEGRRTITSITPDDGQRLYDKAQELVRGD